MLPRLNEQLLKQTSEFHMLYINDQNVGKMSKCN